MFSPRRNSAERHRRVFTVEPLEERQLLSATTSSNYSYRVSQVRHRYDVYVSDLQRLELKSQATPAEALALRNDARAISQDASTSNLSLASAQTKALAVSLLLDRAPLDGSLQQQGWGAITTRLAQSLSGFNVSQPLFNQTIADMQAIAKSAGVSNIDVQHLDQDMQSLTDAEQWLGSNSYYTFPNPQLYYNQHLRGFFRGGAVEKVKAQAQRNADLRQIQVEAGDSGADAAVLHRDATALEVVGAGLTSDAAAQFNTVYLAAFSAGSPSPQVQAQLPADLRATLGPAPSNTLVSNTNQLAADAPAFFRAVGSSSQNISLILSDIQALVAAGGAQPLDPFKIQVVRTNAAPGAPSVV